MSRTRGGQRLGGAFGPFFLARPQDSCGHGFVGLGHAEERALLHIAEVPKQPVGRCGLARTDLGLFPGFRPS